MPSHTFNPQAGYDLAVDRNLGLGEIFYNRAQKSHQAIAVCDGGAVLTYGQLHAKAYRLAQELSQWLRLTEKPVGIVVQHGMADVVAQMAVIYAGGSCAPMDPTLPDNQIQGRLKRLDAVCVLTDQANRHRDLGADVLCIDDFDIADLAPEDTLYPVATNLEHCAYLIHTSGTTAEPKAVQIAARSILHVAFYAPLEPVYDTDVVAHANNSSFDVSLFDIWVPLLRGAQIAVINKAVLLDPPMMAREIDRLGITVMATTTAVLNLAAFIYPKAFAKLRLVTIGGEAANVAAIRIILKNGPPAMLFNAYGPTECCVFCLAHQITPADVEHGSIGVSIGKPVGRTITYIAGDEGGESDQGELWIGGPGVSPGYFRQPEKNLAAFSDLGEAMTSLENPVRFYRTGDIVRRRPNGALEYVGRRDHQVKVRGFRIELEAVEAGLLKTGLFSDAVAMRIEMPQNGAGSILAAYVVPTDVSKPPTMDEALESAKSILPHYMVPQLELVPRLPLNRHLKVDRKQLAELFGRRWEDVSPAQPENASQDVRSALVSLWATVLASPLSTYGDDDDFLHLGGTSLQAAMLINQIRHKFDIEVSLLTLYDNTTLGALTSIIKQRLSGQSETLHNEKDSWVADSEIADDLSCPLDRPIDWCRDTEGRVFLTGGTGFVGAFLLADLLHMPQTSQVRCLVRATDAAVGQERLRAALDKYGLWEDGFADKLVAIAGLLEDDYLGMGREQFEEAASWASVVFHLGARVNYAQPYSLHRASNTLGTRNMVRFACAGRTKAIHYVSSIGCFGPTGSILGTTSVREDEPLLPHITALPYDHGYAQSQWVADALLRRLMDRGFPIAIYRPGFIVGHSQTGACNPDDFLSRLIDACREIGCYPQLPNQRKEFVPVDYVNAAILHIAASPASLGHAYHIVPPTRAVSIDMDNSMALVDRAGNSPMRPVSYKEWVERLAATSPKRLLPLQPMLAERVKDGLTRWELYENMPVYETTNTARALQNYPGGLQFPVLDTSLMKRYLDFLEAKG
uniref:Non-canonical nonribosomal peptide synthetase FrzA n=1 Tax=Cladobotryum sp. TaxID=2040732 RepID=FRZA_CLASX|nr:FrzA [Cladobotryum sp.]